LAISFKYSDAPPRPDFQGASCRLAFPDAGEMAGKHAGFGFCSSPVPGSAAFRRATDTRVLPTLLPRPNSVCTDVKPGAHCLPQPCVQPKAAWQRQRQRTAEVAPEGAAGDSALAPSFLYSKRRKPPGVASCRRAPRHAARRVDPACLLSESRERALFAKFISEHEHNLSESAVPLAREAAR